MRCGRLLSLAGTLAAAATLLTMQAAAAMPPPIDPVGSGSGGESLPSASTSIDDRCAIRSRSAAERLPRLDGALAGAVARYGRELPAAASDLAWYDSGGSFGGGVPVREVGRFIRVALAMGLSSGEVSGFLDPRFLRGIGDPNGGGGLLAFIAEHGDPALVRELAAYAGTARSTDARPMEAQRALFDAFPLLVIAYEALAGVPPLDEEGAATMADLAEDGYGPARRTIDRILTAGNHPQAGAQSSGSVADGVRPDVYDFFVMHYEGPLSPGARIAVANRWEYLAWVERIASWVASGSSVDQIPATASFSNTDPSSSTVVAVAGSRVSEPCSA